MSGKTVRIAVLAAAIIALGITFKPFFRPGGLFCTAEDSVNDTLAPQDGASVEEAGVGTIPPAPAAAARTSSPGGSQPVAEGRVPALPAASAPVYDFSDSSSWNLTVSAWEHMAQKDFDGVFAYANKCLELYEAKAKELAPQMKHFARPGREDDFAVVNDVATCRYIMGETYMKTGRTAEALREFRHVIDTYPYAQCWDPKGWFWKVAEVSRKNLEKIGISPAPQEGGQK